MAIPPIHPRSGRLAGLCIKHGQDSKKRDSGAGIIILLLNRIERYGTLPFTVFRETSDMDQSSSPKAEARKDEIIAAAATVFFDKGFSRTSMDDVIGLVRGSKRTLYKYFSSKDDLFFAVVTRVVDRTMEGLTVEQGSDLPETLRQFGVSYLSAIVSPDGLSLFRAVSAEVPYLPKLGERFLHDATDRVLSLLAGYFEEQNQAATGGRIKDPPLAAAQFLALVRGQVHFAALLGGGVPDNEQIAHAVNQAVETFLHGAVDRADTPSTQQ